MCRVSGWFETNFLLKRKRRKVGCHPGTIKLNKIKLALPVLYLLSTFEEMTEMNPFEKCDTLFESESWLQSDAGHKEKIAYNV